MDISHKAQDNHSTIHRPKTNWVILKSQGRIVKLTQKGKLNSHLMCMERGSWVGEEVRRGTGKVVRCGKGWE